MVCFYFRQTFDGLESLVTEKTPLFLFLYISVFECNNIIPKDAQTVLLI